MPDSPVPDLPNASGGEALERVNDKERKTPGVADDTAGVNKSPLLTAHRISVTSDMDDVSLEEGTVCPI